MGVVFSTPSDSEALMFEIFFQKWVQDKICTGVENSDVLQKVTRKVSPIFLGLYCD